MKVNSDRLSFDSLIYQSSSGIAKLSKLRGGSVEPQGKKENLQNGADPSAI